MNLAKVAEGPPIAEIISKHPLFRQMAPDHLKLLADAAMFAEFKEGEMIFNEGDPANRFYLILKGQVALETSSPDGALVVLHTLGPDDFLGWSWLFTPYYWHFDARAIQDTKAIFFYGTWLRESCESDHSFGYEMMKRMSAVLIDRLQATRRQLARLQSKH